MACSYCRAERKILAVGAFLERAILQLVGGVARPGLWGARMGQRTLLLAAAERERVEGRLGHYWATDEPQRMALDELSTMSLQPRPARIASLERPLKCWAVPRGTDAHLSAAGEEEPPSFHELSSTTRTAGWSASSSRFPITRNVFWLCPSRS